MERSAASEHYRAYGECRRGGGRVSSIRVECLPAALSDRRREREGRRCRLGRGAVLREARPLAGLSFRPRDSGGVDRPAFG